MSVHCLILGNSLSCEHLERATTKSSNLPFGPGQTLLVTYLTAVLLWSHKRSIIINLLFSDDAVFKTVSDVFIFPSNILPFSNSIIGFFNLKIHS